MADWRADVYEVQDSLAERDSKPKKRGTEVLQAPSQREAKIELRRRLSRSGYEVRSINRTVLRDRLVAYVYGSPRPRPSGATA